MIVVNQHFADQGLRDYGDSAFNIAWPRAAAPLLARARAGWPCEGTVYAGVMPVGSTATIKAASSAIPMAEAAGSKPA